LGGAVSLNAYQASRFARSGWSLGLTIDIGRPRWLRSGDALVRALGWKRGVVTVVDATAGLGRDAAALARVGFTVLAVERSATVAALWREALPQAPHGLSFLKGDAKDLLHDLAAAGLRPDAVYIDAMYPAGKRKAASQKALVLLREIVGDDIDVESLLGVALEIASKRVVVKRPKKAQVLRGGVAHSWVCASTRYDLYLVHPQTTVRACPLASEGYHPYRPTAGP